MTNVEGLAVAIVAGILFRPLSRLLALTFVLGVIYPLAALHDWYDAIANRLESNPSESTEAPKK